MKRFLLTAAFLALAPPAFSATHWNVDAAKSKLGFTLPWGKEPFVASFKNWNAAVDFDPADLAHAHVVANINIGSETSGDADTDESLKGEQGFSVGKFPTAKFETKNFQHLNGDNYAAEGTLTIRGVTKPVHLPFTLTIKGNDAHMVGDAQVKWADFGLGADMGAEMPAEIGKMVTIHIDLAAKKS